METIYSILFIIFFLLHIIGQAVNAFNGKLNFIYFITIHFFYFYISYAITLIDSFPVTCAISPHPAKKRRGKPEKAY